MLQLRLKIKQKGKNLAVKDDIKVIKDELSTEEQFLEGMIKGERFLKKYKFALIGVAVLAVVAGVGYYVLKSIEQSNMAKTNIAYNKALENDTNALNSLKNDAPSLYALAKFKEFQDKNDTQGVKSLISADIDPLLKQIFSAYAGEASGAILADYSLLIDGYELLKQNKIKEANAEFSKISADSPLTNIVKNLQHYQGIKQ